MRASILLFGLLACAGDDEPEPESGSPVTSPGATAGDTAPPVANLEAPTDLALERREGALVITWTDAPGADRHDVFLATEAGVSPRNVDTRANGQRLEDQTSPALVAGLPDGSTVHVVVAGVLDDLAGPPSTERSATLDCAPGECVCTEALAVGYDVDNNTCGFVGLPGAPVLPELSLDEWQYNTLFSGVGYGAAFGADGGAFRDDGEGRACGATPWMSASNARARPRARPTAPCWARAWGPPSAIPRPASGTRAPASEPRATSSPWSTPTPTA